MAGTGFLVEDPAGDYSGGRSTFDIVGTQVEPASYMHSDGTTLFVRVRLGEAPVQTGHMVYRSDRAHGLHLCQTEDGRPSMPWKETDTVDQRTQFIAAVLRGELPFAEVCKRFGVSRPTGYKWLHRYKEGGFSELTDRPRSRYEHANATPPGVVELIVASRLAHPTWGPRKLKAFLTRKYPMVVFPAASTIGSILSRHGLVAGRRRRKRGRPATSPLPEPTRPNGSWSIDFKGQFELTSGDYCYPLTLMDAHSRYLLRCQALNSIRTEGVWPILEAAFLEYGLPDAIRSDNGVPFACGSFTGLTPLSAWWVAHGIILERIEPGKPQQNGRLERFHRTLKKETTKPASDDFDSQQRRFSTFIREYNDERPHESLNNDVPNDHFFGSSRSYTRSLPEPDYPADAMIRLVSTKGSIQFNGYEMSLACCLEKKPIAFVPTDDGRWDLMFYNHRLAVFDERKETLSNGRITRELKKKSRKPRRKEICLPFMTKV